MSGDGEALPNRQGAWIAAQLCDLGPRQKQRNTLRLSFGGLMQRFERAVEISKRRIEDRRAIRVLTILSR